MANHNKQRQASNFLSQIKLITTKNTNASALHGSDNEAKRARKFLNKEFDRTQAVAKELFDQQSPEEREEGRNAIFNFVQGFIDGKTSSGQASQNTDSNF